HSQTSSMWPNAIVRLDIYDIAFSFPTGSVRARPASGRATGIPPYRLLSPHDYQHRVGRRDVALAVRAEHGEGVVARLQIGYDDLGRPLRQFAHLFRAVVQLQLLPAGEPGVVHLDGDTGAGVPHQVQGVARRVARRGDLERPVVGRIGPIDEGEVLVQ